MLFYQRVRWFQFDCLICLIWKFKWFDSFQMDDPMGKCWNLIQKLRFDMCAARHFLFRTAFWMILECKFTMLGKDSKGFIGISWGLQWKCGSTWSFWLNRNNWVAQIQPKWGADKKPFKFDTWNQFMQQRKNMGVSGNWIYPKKCYLIRNMMF
jgi:hypothetical protein